MKIPFDIKHKPQIESGEYKVETRDGMSARIICWDRVAKENTDDDLNICVLVSEDNGEAVYYYHQSGKKWVSDERFDLFLITPEPELSEFEQKVRVCVTKNLTTHIKDGNGREMSSTVFIDDDTAKKLAAELLKLARKELCKQIVDHNKEAYENGKAEALKDLPRWRKEQGEMEIAAYGIIGGGVASRENPRVYLNGHSIDLYSLEKLPRL